MERIIVNWPIKQGENNVNGLPSELFLQRFRVPPHPRNGDQCPGEGLLPQEARIVVLWRDRKIQVRDLVTGFCPSCQRSVIWSRS